jgi:hypothetical protein
MSLNIEYPESTTYWIMYNGLNYAAGLTESNQVTSAPSWSVHLITEDKDQWIQEQQNLGLSYLPAPILDELEPKN